MAYELRKVRLNRNMVDRFVNTENPNDRHIVPSGVDDPDSSFLKDKEKYPKAHRYHEEFKEKEVLRREMSSGEQDLWIHRNPSWGIKVNNRRRR
jgi:hypothetical protein